MTQSLGAEMKLLHWIFAGLFLLSAFLQLNDPDPLYWSVVYAAAGAVALARGMGRRYGDLETVVLGGVMAGILMSAPGFIAYLRAGDLASLTGSMASASHVEPAREFLGLAIVMTVLLVYRRR
jgi:Transmembrane family 220, helix